MAQKARELERREKAEREAAERKRQEAVTYQGELQQQMRQLERREAEADALRRQHEATQAEQYRLATEETARQQRAATERQVCGHTAGAAGRPATHSRAMRTQAPCAMTECAGRMCMQARRTRRTHAYKRTRTCMHIHTCAHARTDIHIHYAHVQTCKHPPVHNTRARRHRSATAAACGPK